MRLGPSRDIALAGWLFVAMTCFFGAYVARLNEITHDVFHEMALFREALVLGEFPQNDVFAYTPTKAPAVHHEWGTGAILYLVTMETGLGLVGLSALRLLLMAGLWWLLYRVARMRGAHPYAFACLACVTFPFFWVGFSMLRAQLFTLVFIAAQMWMQEHDRRGRRVWVIFWWLMLVAWLNIHAGFLVGLGMFGFHCLERLGGAWLQRKSVVATVAETWHLLLAGVAIPLALPLNPYGWKYVPYLLHAVRMPRPLIKEWHSIWHIAAPQLTLLAFAVSLLLIVYAARRRPVRRLSGIAFLSVCALEAIKHIRHGSIYGVVWLAYVPAWLTHTPLGRLLIGAVERQRLLVIRLSQLIAASCLLFACINEFWRPTLPCLPSQSIACQPSSAVDYLHQQGFRGNLLTQFNQGAYVSWRLYPDVKVSLDGRYEVAYPSEFIEVFHQFVTGAKGWERILDQYGGDAILINQQAEVRKKLEVFRGESLVTPQPTQKRWRFVYEDDGFVILAAEPTCLPYVNRLGEPLGDGAGDLFSDVHSHRSHSRQRSLASR